MRPVGTTIKALRKIKAEMSYRALAKKLGYEEGMIATLSDLLAKKGIKVSLEKENDIRRRLGLHPITESGNLVRKRKIERPYVTTDQTKRKQNLGVEWDTIIEAGLSTLESNYAKTNLHKTST